MLSRVVTDSRGLTKCTRKKLNLRCVGFDSNFTLCPALVPLVQTEPFQDYDRVLHARSWLALQKGDHKTANSIIRGNCFPTCTSTRPTASYSGRSHNHILVSMPRMSTYPHMGLRHSSYTRSLAFLNTHVRTPYMNVAIVLTLSRPRNTFHVNDLRVAR